MMLLIRPKPTVFVRTKRFTIVDLILLVPKLLIRSVMSTVLHVLGTYGTAFAIAGLGLILAGFFSYKGDVHAIWALVRAYAYTIVLFILLLFHLFTLFVKKRKEY
ncbi:MAG: hypothetical protein K2X81_08690 [Candidatus Obscuribacterales bacterium]|nr:hypothetical protein [Candidatus Obscuribacterales bacterium]